MRESRGSGILRGSAAWAALVLRALIPKRAVPTDVTQNRTRTVSRHVKDSMQPMGKCFWCHACSLQCRRIPDHKCVLAHAVAGRPSRPALPTYLPTYLHTYLPTSPRQWQHHGGYPSILHFIAPQSPTPPYRYTIAPLVRAGLSIQDAILDPQSGLTHVVSRHVNASNLPLAHEPALCTSGPSEK